MGSSASGASLLLSLSLVLGLGLWSPLAHSQPAEDRATARLLAEDADRKLSAGDLAGALELFTKADAIFPAPTLRLARAHILEKQGLLVESRELLIDAVRSEAQPNEPASWSQARKSAQQEAEALGARIPRLVLTVEGVPASRVVTVQVDGKRVPRSALGVERPINPGKHLVRAEAEGYVELSQTIQLAEGELYRSPLKLVPEVEPKPAESAPAASSAPPAASSSAPLAPSAPTPTPTLAIVGFGAAGTFTVAGVILGVMTLSKVSSIKSDCTLPAGHCPSSLRPESDRAGTYATLSNVGFLLGVVGVGVGLYGLFTPPSEPSAPPPSEPGVVFKVGLGSAQISGRF